MSPKAWTLSTELSEVPCEKSQTMLLLQLVQVDFSSPILLSRSLSVVSPVELAGMHLSHQTISVPVFARVEPPFMQEVHRSACAIVGRVSIKKGAKPPKPNTETTPNPQSQTLALMTPGQ